MVAPRFTVNTRANFTLGAGTVFGTAAIVGLASWGEIDTAVDYSTFTDIKDVYKSGQIVDAAEQFFIGGGTELKVVRLAATADRAKATIQLLNGATPAVQLDGKYFGTYGNSIYVTVTVNGSNRDIEIGDGVTTETYEDLADNDEVIAALADSVLVDATKLTSDFIDASSKAFLTLGDDGDTVVTADYSTIVTDILFTKDWDYLFIPEQVSDAFHTTIAGLMDNRATNENKYSLFITGVDKFEQIATTIARTATNSNGRLIVCHTAQYIGTGDRDTTTNWRDATYTAATYTGKLCSLPVNTSPTFKSLPMIGGKLLANEDYNRAEKDTLVDAGFTVVDLTFTNVYGVIRGVNRVGNNTAWNYLTDNMRKVDYIKQNVYDKSTIFIGDPNDDKTRRTLRASIISFLVDTQRDRIIEEYEVEVLQGSSPDAVIINTSVLLVNELAFITFNLVLNV